jgi:uncharacterized protein (UPF0261 family)
VLIVHRAVTTTTGVNLPGARVLEPPFKKRIAPVEGTAEGDTKQPSFTLTHFGTECVQKVTGTVGTDSELQDGTGRIG